MIFDTWRFIQRLDVPNEIADNFDFTRSGVRKFDANKFIFDQYHQLEFIEPIETEIVTEVRFICNLFSINAQILGNKRAYFVSVKIFLWGASCVHCFPPISPYPAA